MRGPPGTSNLDLQGMWLGVGCCLTVLLAWKLLRGATTTVVWLKAQNQHETSSELCEVWTVRVFCKLACLQGCLVSLFEAL